MTVWIHFSEFKVTRAVDLINACGDVAAVAPSGIPDHSLLSWDICVVAGNNGSGDRSDMPLGVSYDKFDVTKCSESLFYIVRKLYLNY